MSLFRTYRSALGAAALFTVLSGMPIALVWAQNTKGDQPVRTTRETRFKPKSSKSQKQGGVFNRIIPARKSPAAKSQPVGKTGKPIRPVYSGRPSEEKAWKGNAAGNRLTVRSVTGRTRNVYPQRGRFVHNPSPTPDRSQEKWRAVKPTRVYVRSATGRTRNVYPQTGRYVHNPSRSPQRSEQRVVSNKSIIARNLSSPSLDEPPRRKKRVVPASASRPYITRKSINPYAGFWNRKQKGERAYIGDIAGRRLRTKNYESPRPPVQAPTTTPYYGRKRVGDRPYKGPALGGYISATRTGRAWQGDIAGRKIRGRNFSSKSKIEQTGQPVHPPRLSRQQQGDRPYRGTLPGGGYKTITRPGEKRVQTSPLPPRLPGKNAKGIDTWSGNIRGRKTFADQGIGFAGAIKARKPLKGGGSISGQLWNNRGQPVPGKTPGIGARRVDTYSGNIRGRKVFGDQGEGYTGSIKARKPQKGGGSISGQLWNNRGQPVPGKTPGIGARRVDTYSGNIRGRKVFGDQGEGYTGSIKARKPQKGGGSISGQLWNNRGQPVPGKPPGIGARRIDTYSGNIRGRKVFGDQGEEYAGAIKAKKPKKGGGSVSGRLWNNNQQPVQGKMPVELPGNFPGKYRLFDLKPSQRDQGEEYTGALKAKRPKKGGGSVSGKLWNNKEQPIPVRTPDESAAKAARYAGNIRAGKKEPDKSVGGFPGKHHQFDFQPDMRDQGEEFTGYTRLSRFKRNYLKNPNQAEEAIKKQRPDKNTYETEGLQVRVKRQPYVDNENSADESLDKLKPSKFNARIAGLQVKVKEGNYKTKPNAAADALEGVAPGKSSVKASEFSKVVKQDWDYRHNPSSDKAALEVREPGKAFGRVTDYQGNIRMKKFELFEKKDLHPDAQFVKTNKNNVKDERDWFTSIKLWWGKMFRKTETQPDHLKEKVRKPRFDKREIGLWYD